MGWTIKDNSEQFIQKVEDVMDTAMSRMIQDIATVAKIKAPFKHGDLTKEIKPERVAKFKYIVLVNLEYAAYQEKGERADGTHKIRKYTTPGTGAHFLENAGDQVVEQVDDYLKQAANDVRMNV